MGNKVLNHSPWIEKASRGALWFGIILALGGLVIFTINPGLRWAVSTMEALALIQFIFFFIIHFETIKAFSTRRSTKLGLNSVLMVVIFLSIVSILNFLASQHSKRIDLSETNRFTLAPQTLKVLKNLNREVKITAFTQSQTGGEIQIKDLLDSYTHQTHQISFELIDPDKKPAIAKRYGITQYNTLVLESGKQEAQIKEATEQNLTNAIIRVNRDKKRKILFLKNHGEHRLSDTEKDGYSYVKESLQNMGYGAEELSLLETGEVPGDTNVLVIAGPQKPFLPEEKLALTAYLEKGGKVMALLDPQANLNLDDFLLEWGLRVGHGIIVDTLSRLMGGDITIPVVSTYPEHEITEGFNIATFFPIAQTITFDSSYGHLEFQPIAQTSPNSWSKRELTGQEIRIDPQVDSQGPFTLAGIVTSKTPFSQKAGDPDLPTPAPGTDTPTLLLFGDSDFANNAAFYFSGNGDLFLNSINYLAKEGDLIAITAKKHNFSPLFLTKTQGQVLLYLSLFVVPGVVFLTGFGIWRRRRLL